MEQGTLRAMLEGVALTMSKDPTRPHLHGVLFVFKRETLTLVSTDGQRLTRVQASYTDEEQGPNETTSYLIKAADVKTLLTAVKGTKKEHSYPVTFELEPKGIKVSVFLGASYGFQAQDETFPPYEKVIPEHRASNGKGCATIGVSAAFLGDVGKAGKHLAYDKSGGIRWSVEGDRDPIRIDMTNTDTGTETTIVIMPMRI
jgi:DNA polymerase-3 subunit beta